jgi:hypothetical protein
VETPRKFISNTFTWCFHKQKQLYFIAMQTYKELKNKSIKTLLVVASVSRLISCVFRVNRAKCLGENSSAIFSLTLVNGNASFGATLSGTFVGISASSFK